MMIKLTPHEQKILDIVKEHPEVIHDPEKRKEIAEQHGLSEKTLRNRIGDLKKYSILNSDGGKIQEESETKLNYTIEEQVRIIENKNSRPLLQLIGTIFRHRYTLIIFNGAVVITTIIVLLLIPNWYRSTVAFVINEKENIQINDIVPNMNILSMVPNIGNQATQYIALLNSRRIFDQIIDEFDLQNVYELQYLDDVYKSLQHNSEFIDNENGTISISCMYKESPDKAAQMANRFYNHLYNLSLELERNNAIIYREYIEVNQAISLDSLKQLEEAFRIFQIEKGLYSINEQVKASIESLASMELEKVRMEVEFDYLSIMYGDIRPDLISLGVKLETVKDKIEKMKTDNNYVQLPTKNIPNNSMLYYRHYRNIIFQEKITEFLTLKLEQAKLEERKTTANIYLLDKAIPMEKKAWPPRTVYLVITMFFSSTLSIIYFRIKDLLKIKYSEIKKIILSH